MAVWENLYLSHESSFTTLGIISRKAGIRRARALLERFGHGWIDPARAVESYPFAIRQIIEILKAFALAELLGHDEPIILLDEPTSFMDSWAEAAWFERFRSLAEGRTALLITHRFTIAMRADVIHVMDQGRIVESGTHHELVARGGLYAVSWEAQMQAGHAATREPTEMSGGVRAR